MNFRFSDLPEVLTELRKANILMIMVYHCERIQLRISKGKDIEGGVQERPGATFQLSVLSQWSCMDSI